MAIPPPPPPPASPGPVPPEDNPHAAPPDDGPELEGPAEDVAPEETSAPSSGDEEPDDAGTPARAAAADPATARSVDERIAQSLGRTDTESGAAQGDGPASVESSSSEAPAAPAAPAQLAAPGTGFARPEAGPAINAPTAAHQQPGAPAPYGQPGYGQPGYGYPQVPRPGAGYPQPGQAAGYARPVQGPQAPGYYPQETYYAAGWNAPAEAATPKRGHARLFLSLAIGVLLLLLIAGAIAWFANWNQTRELGEITGETNATARQVRTGHCIVDIPADGAVESVTLVPCSEPHEAEVVGTHRLEGDDWPGQDAVDDDVMASCEMDRTAVELGFQGVVWTPSESSWAQGDRTGLCIAWYPDGDVTGSFDDGDVEVR